MTTPQDPGIVAALNLPATPRAQLLRQLHAIGSGDPAVYAGGIRQYALYGGGPPGVHFVDPTGINFFIGKEDQLILDWVSVTAYGADPTGKTDSTVAIQNAIAALPNGGVVYLPAGTYLVSSPLLVNIAGITLLGAGFATKIQLTAIAASIVSITSDFCGIEDIAFIGGSVTITSNPAGSAIAVTGARYCRIRNVFAQYVNGWALIVAASGSVACIDLKVDGFTALNCAGGISDTGLTGASSFGGQHFYDLVQLGQIGVGTGTFANLDAAGFFDVSDILIGTINISASDASTGAAFHVSGACSNIKVGDLDAGCFPNVGSESNPVLLIDSATGNGDPFDLDFVGTVQQGQTGVQVNGGASKVTFDKLRVKNNYGHGMTLNGTGSDIDINECIFSGNGAGVSGTNTTYDLNVTGTSTGACWGSRFESAIVASGAGVVTSVNIANGQNVAFDKCQFTGTGIGLGTCFTHNPITVRNCRGFNPHGTTTVTVPATGNSTLALAYDAYFYVTAGTGGLTVTRQAGSGGGGTGPAMTIAAGVTETVFVPARATLLVTYTNAPTWLVDGN